jgi:pimeloyl-ACP methyl ester carboxylesterase
MVKQIVMLLIATSIIVVLPGSLAAQQDDSVQALFDEWGLTPAQIDQFIATFDGATSVQDLQEFVDFGDYTIAEIRQFMTEDFGPPPVGGGAQVPTGADGTFTPSDCPFDVPPGQRVDCGVLTVPENRSQPNGNSISLVVGIFRSYSANPQSDPIIYLEGGPGGGALAGAEAWLMTPLRNDRDVIVFDQRGTGYSIPSLNCPELDEADDILQATQECHSRLVAEGVDLTAYNSRENATDVEALRVALGIDQANLLGISYGTRLALTVMRDHPGNIRSVVLDSVYPPNVDSNYTNVTDTYALANAMFADCAADAACSAAFPDIQNRFWASLDQWAEQPIAANDPETGDVVELYVEDILNNLFQQLQRTDLISAIPASLEALLNDDGDAYLILATQGAGDGPPVPFSFNEALVQVEIDLDDLQQNAPDVLQDLQDAARAGDTAFIAQDYVDCCGWSPEDAEVLAQAFVAYVVDGARPSDGETIDDDSEGMNMSVQCYEELPFMDVDEAYNRSFENGAPQIFVDAIFPGFEFDQCDIWQVGAADAIENQAVVSDIPTLVTAGPYDTATPPDWSLLSAQTLSNSYFYVFEGVGHGVLFGGECPERVITSFIANPLQEPDAGCVSGLRPSFYTGDGSELLDN